MGINELVKKAHENAIDKGFYECPKCKGDSFNGLMFDSESCEYCKNTHIDPNHNIGEKLMLIVSELGEALEAHRKNKFSDEWDIDSLDATAIDSDWMSYFKNSIKDTFEDEIADAFIRLADMCGYLNIDIEKFIWSKMEYNKTRPHKHGKEY